MIKAVLLIVRRSLRQHALSTCVTLLATALASGLVMSVFSIQRQTNEAFTGGELGFDAVLGARGSQLQLVLNTVFHLETSPGNIPWSMYEALKNDRRIAIAIPYATGDNYHGFRVVGTTDEIFTAFEYRAGQKFAVESGGRFFDASRREAVIGSFAAAQTGLKPGDVVNPYHGLTFSETSKHAEEYTVVGILKPTNSPSDRVIFIPIEGIFRMGGHVLRGTGDVYQPQSGVAIENEHKEVSAVMLKFKNPKTGFDLDMTINKQGKAATLAYPIGRVMAELFDKLGWISRVLELVAYLVVAVASAAILASIYNTINERRREFAILRALGARRATVFSAIVLEAAAIAGIGSLIGFVVYAVILGAAMVIVRAQTGVVLDVWSLHPALYWTPLGMTAVGALAGVLPAYKAYATDVATNLTPAS
ncbi:MAG: FtsX-like permease family protein [Candidatus Hydrogenedentes bacterium]|nr:FtsX-like permease family protein [Candidatus Hydrogenedentota bacterium]